MPTNTPGSTARRFHHQQIHYLRKRIAFDDTGLTGEVGRLPAGAIILRGSVYVSTAFNAGTLGVGVQGGTGTEYLSAGALTPAAIVAITPTIANAVVAADNVVTFTRSAAAAAGEARIVIEYTVNNSGG